MLKLLTYIMKNGIATVADPCPPLETDADGMPMLTEQPCSGSECNVCAAVCPTNAISVAPENGGKVTLDLGSCIGCQLCIDVCPTGTITNNRSTKLAKKRRSDLILNNKSNQRDSAPISDDKKIFKRSLHARVVSTGCSACDLEIGATSNPVFDLERFGVHIVASPRFADALIVTGPVGKGMRDSLLRCYAAMPDPKVVIAVGTCAISGGVHKNGYAEANGLDKILPVDVYIPGCPPHPWSIIHCVSLAMGKIDR
jgi:Ni,Fe-hydrogenase III small subunit/Pyruvate/2-oxoacid:ferredoxin oxidoreductase delta subunit